MPRARRPSLNSVRRAPSRKSSAQLPVLARAVARPLQRQPANRWPSRMLRSKSAARNNRRPKPRARKNAPNRNHPRRIAMTRALNSNSCRRACAYQKSIRIPASGLSLKTRTVRPKSRMRKKRSIAGARNKTAGSAAFASCAFESRLLWIDHQGTVDFDAVSVLSAIHERDTPPEYADGINRQINLGMALKNSGTRNDFRNGGAFVCLQGNHSLPVGQGINHLNPDQTANIHQTVFAHD